MFFEKYMSRHISTTNNGKVENGVEIEVVAPSATAFLLKGVHGKPKGHSGNGLYVQGRGCTYIKPLEGK